MLFQHRSFFASLFLTRLGDQILLFLVPLVVFQITGSVSWSGLAFFFETLPRYIAFPLSGILCDRYPAYKLLRISQVLRALTCAIGIGCQMAFGGVWWLIVLSAVSGVLTTQGLMAREAILPRAFTAHRFEAVASYTQLADQLGTVLGPLVAAFCLQFWPWEAVVVLAAGLFVLADIASFLWSGKTDPSLIMVPVAQAGWGSSLRLALNRIWSIPGLMRPILLAASVNLIIGVTLATSAAMVTGLQGQSEATYALLQAAGALATIVVLLITAHVTLRLNTLGLVGYAAICAGAFVTSFGTSPLFYAFGFVLITGFDKMFNVYVRTLRKTLIPLEDFGKTTGMIVCFNNLSQPLAGLLVTLFAIGDDARAVILALALVMAFVGAAVLLTTRSRPEDFTSPN